MPWVRFDRDFNFKAKARVLIAYKAGRGYLVSQRAAKEAIEAGAGRPCYRGGEPIDGATDEGGGEQT